MAEKLILIADDEPNISLLLQKRLSLAGYQSTIANDGQTCLDTLKTNKPDLLLLDIDLPIINGSDLLNILRKDKDTKTLPIIILTGLTEHDCEQDTSYGTRELFMTKPIDFEKLIIEIKKRIG